MSDYVAFTVLGAAMPQGSKSYKGHRGGKPILIESSKGLAPWRLDVGRVARLAHRGDPWEGPCIVEVAFDYRRPPSHLLTDGVSLSSIGKRAPYPGHRADIDKACRAILDAVSGVVFHDDDQVTALNATKGWGPRDEARVCVRRLGGATWAQEALYVAGELEEPRAGGYRVPRVWGALDQVALDQIALDFTGSGG